MKGGVQILWNAIAICDMSTNSWQTGKHRTKDDLENHSKGQEFLLGALVEYHPFSPKDQSRIDQFGKNVFPGIFFGYELIAGEIWKGDVLIADLEDLETLDASDIYPRRIKSKEVLVSHKNDEFVFRIADGTAKLSGRGYEFGVSTLRREHIARSEDLCGEIQGESEESQQAEPTDDIEARGDFLVDSR